MIDGMPTRSVYTADGIYAKVRILTGTLAPVPSSTVHEVYTADSGQTSKNVVDPMPAYISRERETSEGKHGEAGVIAVHGPSIGPKSILVFI